MRELQRYRTWGFKSKGEDEGRGRRSGFLDSRISWNSKLIDSTPYHFRLRLESTLSIEHVHGSITSSNFLLFFSSLPSSPLLLLLLPPTSPLLSRRFFNRVLSRDCIVLRRKAVLTRSDPRAFGLPPCNDSLQTRSTSPSRSPLATVSHVQCDFKQR